MKIYVSFGQQHTHSHNGITLDKNCLGEIEAPTEQEARDLAFEWFDGVFATTYNEEAVNERLLSFFPRGIIKLN